MDQSLLADAGNKNDYASMPVPAWNAVQNLYAERWAKEKEKFQKQIGKSYRDLLNALK